MSKSIEERMRAASECPAAMRLHASPRAVELQEAIYVARAWHEAQAAELREKLALAERSLITGEYASAIQRAEQAEALLREVHPPRVQPKGTVEATLYAPHDWIERRDALANGPSAGAGGVEPKGCEHDWVPFLTLDVHPAVKIEQVCTRCDEHRVGQWDESGNAAGGASQ